MASSLHWATDEDGASSRPSWSDNDNDKCVFAADEPCIQRVVDAKEIMPGYSDYADQLSPEEFIRNFWDVATDEMRGCMIDYIHECPFEGSIKYIAEWVEHIKRIYRINQLT